MALGDRYAPRNYGPGPLELRTFLVGLGWAPEVVGLEGNEDTAGAEVVALNAAGEILGRYVRDGEDVPAYSALRSLPTFLRPEDLEAAGWDLWEGF